ncbi:MAG: hypothetical protein DRO76_04980 [Candidatus Altiarchaeales archaeon]|nr:MAG: hypothetical protein DRO76_04980 [Candidatus Altiarchaeales archaeon]
MAIKLYYDGRREKEIGDILGGNIRTLRRWNLPSGQEKARECNLQI